MDSREYLVRVQFQNNIKYLSISDTDLEWKKFVDKGESEIIDASNDSNESFFLFYSSAESLRN